MAGKILIYIVFLSSVLSMALFFAASLGKTDYRKYARLFFHVSAVSVIAVSAFLLYLILTYQYQYAYVWEYSNKDLPLSLLISTFYAGQEGSFLLWTLFTAIIGIFLLNYVSKGERMEAQVMTIYTLVLGFLGLILILKTPFQYIWEMFPGEVKQGFVPEDGRGLNPLLQNFWMAIHPPVLFAGFASLAVPFSFAIAALIKNRYQQWITIAMPWLLFSSGILGLGIMMGGYWAYGILGWGGYWGWDPVENSSLVPWIISVAAVHTMLSQRKTGGYIKTNLILSILAYLLVLYSTFLTRSGVLGDSSVHSFSDPGSEVYLALVIFISSFLVISAGTILFRIKQLKGLTSQSSKIFSRETALLTGALLLCLSSLIIFIGTSTPIFSKNTVSTDFYNQWNLPIAILIALLTGISVFIQWKDSPLDAFLKKLYIPLGISFLGTILLIIIGVTDIMMIILAFVSLLTIFVNGQILFKNIKKPPRIGAQLGHIGIALMFLGIIGSGFYSSEENLDLPLNTTKDAFGYSFTFLGPEKIEDVNNKANSKILNVRMEKDNKEVIMKPVHYLNTIGDGYSTEPDIAYFFPTKDVYLSIKNYSEAEIFHREYVMKKGDKAEFEGVNFEFADFSGKGANMSGSNPVGVILIATDNKTVDTLIPALQMIQGKTSYIPAHLSSRPNYIFYLEKMNVSGENSTATIYVEDSGRKTNDETLVLSVSVKPFIHILWTGTVVLVLGFFFAAYKRTKDLNNPKPKEEKVNK